MYQCNKCNINVTHICPYLGQLLDMTIHIQTAQNNELHSEGGYLMPAFPPHFPLDREIAQPVTGSHTEQNRTFQVDLQRKPPSWVTY